MNIYNYIENNNDELDTINNLDALILTRLSYLHIENIKERLPISIEKLNNYLDDIKTNRNDKKLIDLLKKNNRFKNIEIIRCQDILDKEKEEQFFALTIKLPNDSLFISFRGTNKNIYGFKEDLNMSYKIIPSCLDGVKYLESEKVCSKIYLGGHSKGGHIAVYAACHTTFFRRLKIVKIFNFDGPGFLDYNEPFLRMKSKIINFFPESSIVGRLLENNGNIIAIKTNKDGIEAHNLYNWTVEDNDLKIGMLSKNSDDFSLACKSLLKTIPMEKRENIINYFFNLMLKGEIKNIRDIDLKKIKDMVNSVPETTKEEKEELMHFFKLLIKCSIPTVIKK